MRLVHISKQVQKELNKIEGRARRWQKAIINQLEDESNSIEDIKEAFEFLDGDLKGYYKAKNSGLKIRIIFKINDDDEIEIFKVENSIDKEYNEIIEIFAAGKRDKIYDIANKRARRVRKAEFQRDQKRKRDQKRR